MNEYALSIENLEKRYQDFYLDNVNIKVEKGTVMGLVGQNGAGKTTILKLILNAVNRNGGSIKIYGYDNIEDEIKAKSLIGYVSDQCYLMTSNKLKDYKKCFSYMYETWSDEIFEHYANQWKLDLNKKINEMSKGTQTKAMLALTLAHQPKILILDEPTSGLDPVARIEVLDIFRDFVSDGEKSVIFSTHITTDLDKIADYITILINGHVTESMSIDKIEEKYAVISGDIASLNGNIGYTVGIRKGISTFEALIERQYIKYFKDVDVHTPNIENMLTFSIWGKENAGRESQGE